MGGVTILEKKVMVWKKKVMADGGRVSRPMMVKAIALLINCDRDTL